MAFRIIDAEVIGYRPYSFTGSDGREVDMVQVFMTYDDNRTQGVACGAMSISNNKCLNEGICLGSKIKAVFAEKRWQYVGTK